jgi:hypothetical protein
MNKPKKLNNNDNICGKCYLYLEILEQAPLPVVFDDVQGFCEVSEKDVRYRCDACKHFLDREEGLKARAREHAYSEYLKRMGYEEGDNDD